MGNFHRHINIYVCIYANFRYYYHRLLLYSATAISMHVCASVRNLLLHAQICSISLSLCLHQRMHPTLRFRVSLCSSCNSNLFEPIHKVFVSFLHFALSLLVLTNVCCVALCARCVCPHSIRTKLLVEPKRTSEIRIVTLCYIVLMHIVIRLLFRTVLYQHLSQWHPNLYLREKADITPLLDVDDMIMMKNKPDWKCVLTYVQSIYRKLRELDELARQQ